jgi:hypothetical protein
MFHFENFGSPKKGNSSNQGQTPMDVSWLDDTPESKDVAFCNLVEISKLLMPRLIPTNES